MLIKGTGEELIRAGLEAAFEYVVEELGIDEVSRPIIVSIGGYNQMFIKA